MNKTTVSPQAKPASFLPPAQGLLQRKCACGNHTVAGGECAECARNKTGLQRKLSIGASNDPLEQEADRVADQVMAAPAHSTVSGASPHIQRYAGQASGQTGTAPASVDRVLAGSGRPLEPALRQDMEQRFGYDFSGVRVHSGEAAEQSARDVNAHAYTSGHNIVFGVGRFAPGTHGGRRLLAHELTHVIQQRESATHGGYVQRDSPSQPTIDQQVAKMALSNAEKASFAQMAATGSVPILPKDIPLTGAPRTDELILGEYFFCSAMQSNPIEPWNRFCIFPGTVVGTPLFDAYREKVIKPEYAKISPQTRVKLAKGEEISAHLKETLVTGPGATKNYEWDAKYQIALAGDSVFVEVRIKLVGAATTDAIKKAWLDGIQAKWNGKFRFNNGKRILSLSFVPIFTEKNPHVTVNVENIPNTSGHWNRSTWNEGSGEGDTQGNAAAHEFGHMIGNKDEYNLPDGKGGKNTLDGVMAFASQDAKERHFTQFLAWLNAHRPVGEDMYKLEQVE